MDNDRLKVVLDTNVPLVSVSSKSKYHWIFEGIMNSSFDLFITNDILMEYEEIISQKFSPTVAKNVIRALLLFPNVYKIDVYYNWNLITEDADDNKFVDCAITSNAHVLVTHDRHFNILRNVKFPKVNVVDVERFRELLL